MHSIEDQSVYTFAYTSQRRRPIRSGPMKALCATRHRQLRAPAVVSRQE
jgi:hypothetical protein